MPENPAFLAAYLKTEGEKTAAFFASLTESQWQAGVFTEGATWIVRNVLAHLLVAEASLPAMFANIRDGLPGMPEGFSFDASSAEQMQRAAALSPQELLEQYKIVRAKTIAFVTTLSADDLEKRGRHPFMGATTLADMIKGICIHNQIHLRDLSRIR
ncbi:MAG: DinB family protein [Anaerolineales bacterium]